EEGPNDVSSELCWVKRAMIERAAAATLLVDHSKLGNLGLELVGPLASLARVILDRPPEAAHQGIFTNDRLELSVAGPGWGPCVSPARGRSPPEPAAASGGPPRCASPPKARPWRWRTSAPRRCARPPRRLNGRAAGRCRSKPMCPAMPA